MSQAESWTVGRLLQWTTDYLKKQGSESPRLDAEVLLSHARQCQRIELYTAFAEEPSEEVRTKFRALVKQRAEGKPVAYLVGTKEFFSLPFQVTESVLIPRPETEHLVVTAIDLVKSMRAAGVTRPLRIADLGTGSGCIAITLAKKIADCQLVAVDRSADALAVAKKNAETLGVADRVEFVQSDWLQAVSKSPQFDLIVSNPPYVSSSEYESLAKSVKNFEPRGALECGPKGTEAIEEIAKQSLEALAPGGYLVVELSPMIAESIEKLFAVAPWKYVRTVKDLANHARVVVGQLEPSHP